MLGCDTRLSPLVKEGEVKSLCRPGVCTLGSACVTPAEEVLVMWWWCDGLRVGLSRADGDVLEAREGDLLWENSVAEYFAKKILSIFNYQRIFNHKSIENYGSIRW